MKVCQCPTCRQVLHRVPEVTEQSERARLDQLVRHATDEHIIPGFEELLAFTSRLKFTMTEMIYRTGVQCIRCETFLERDNGIYVYSGTRAAHCCSRECRDKMVAKVQ